MYASFLILAVLELCSALPLSSLAACQWQPKGFEITDLSIFTPGQSNPNQQQSISFKYAATITTSDGTTTSLTTCSHKGEIVNPGSAYQCQDTQISWVWNGKSLTLGQDYDSPCDDVSQIKHRFGDIESPALNCYPVVPPYPLGVGNLCQTPTGQISGVFSRDTLAFRM